MRPIEFNRFLSAKLLIAVAFHYREERMVFLAEMLSSLFSFPVEGMRVEIMTNTDHPEEQQKIMEICQPLTSAGKSCGLQIHADLPDPFLLTWCFTPLLQNVFMDASRGYTHFLYLEDDIQFSFTNFCYFLTYRERLRPHHLLPAFVRVEFNSATKRLVSTDNWYQKDMDIGMKLPCGDYVFTDLTNPYMAMFILDRELAVEYLASHSCRYETSGAVAIIGVREQAAMGLMYENVPAGFMSRYVVPVAMDTRHIPVCSWIFHLPNNLADCPDTPNGKLPVEALIMSAEISALRMRARQGDGAVQTWLGKCYAEGQEVPENHLEAIHWYLKAANQGDAGAQLVVGALYAAGGPGVKPDYVSAYLWSRLAAATYSSAQDNLRILRTAMHPEQIEQAELLAAHWTIGACLEREEQFYPWYTVPWWTPHMEGIRRRATTGNQPSGERE